MSRKHNWLPIIGNYKSERTGIKYIPKVIDEGPAKGQPQVAIIKSDAWFEAGTIRFSTTIKKSSSGAQVLLNHDLHTQFFIGIGAGGAFGIQTFRNGQFNTLSKSGDDKAQPGTYSIEIKVIGSRIRLFANGVNVCNAIGYIQKCQPALFLRGEESFSIGKIEIKSNPIKAFVVMQFTNEFNDLYDAVIKPTVEKYGIQCIRADDIYTSGPILNDITQSIIESTFIIADISPNNPNVFYEVGYAHAINKPVILLSDTRRDKLPFDVSGFRVIMYENSIGGKSKVEERLNKHIRNIFDE